FKIVRGSPANRLRFRVGDVIKGVNGQEVGTVKGLVAEMRKPVDRWRISVFREGKVRELLINR
ncbi:MAG: PDZ domain-containing protein, partial [Rhodospirillaceae bacterium]